MPKIKTISRPAGDSSPDNQPTPAAPERRPADPLGWRLGGATPAPQRPAAGSAERRREPAPRPHAAVDVRRRRSPSSRFRG